MPNQHARLTLALAVALILPAALARAADEPKVEGDLAKLQGKWSAPAQEGGKVSYTIRGDKLKVVAPTRTYEMTLKLDPAARPEKTIDFRIDEAPDDAKGQTSKGIYKFVGDKFAFCFAPMGDRPTEFKREGYEKILTTLTPEKP